MKEGHCPGHARQVTRDSGDRVGDGEAERRSSCGPQGFLSPPQTSPLMYFVTATTAWPRGEVQRGAQGCRARGEKRVEEGTRSLSEAFPRAVQAPPCDDSGVGGPGRPAGLRRSRAATAAATLEGGAHSWGQNLRVAVAMMPMTGTSPGREGKGAARPESHQAPQCLQQPSQGRALPGSQGPCWLLPASPRAQHVWGPAPGASPWGSRARAGPKSTPGSSVEEPGAH